MFGDNIVDIVDDVEGGGVDIEVINTIGGVEVEGNGVEELEDF